MKKIIVETKYYKHNQKFTFASGESIDDLTIAYETYGTLNAEKNNAILICHALSGDAHAAFYNSENDKKPGWWDIVIGSQKPIDTDKFFVISTNVLGGCKGTSGPKSINQKTGRPYGQTFPFVTIADMVEAERILVEHLGAHKLLAVIGGSMGGMQAILWAKLYTERVANCIVIASALYQSAQNIALHEVGRKSIISDENFAEGNYYDKEKQPKVGLSIARMLAHISYLSGDSMKEKFGRSLEQIDAYSAAEGRYFAEERFSVGSYLEYQGKRFIERFDANSYVYITRAIDYFDLGYEVSKKDVFKNVKTNFLVIGFSSDWLYPTFHSLEIVHACKTNAINVTYCEIESPAGHDAFLIKNERMEKNLGDYLKNAFSKIAGVKTETIQNEYRLDHDMIFGYIENGSKVLDLGCGDGTLLSKLEKEKSCMVQGVEIDAYYFANCVNLGVPVIADNIETLMKDYDDSIFDYVILNLTLQVTHNTKEVLLEALRIGKRVIIGYPNFGYIGIPLYQLINGRMPKSKTLPFEWYNTPNIHLLTTKDFYHLCKECGCQIEKSFYFNDVNKKRLARFWVNKFAKYGMSVVKKNR